MLDGQKHSIAEDNNFVGRDKCMKDCESSFDPAVCKDGCKKDFDKKTRAKRNEMLEEEARDDYYH